MHSSRDSDSRMHAFRMRSLLRRLDKQPKVYVGIHVFPPRTLELHHLRAGFGTINLIPRVHLARLLKASPPKNTEHHELGIFLQMDVFPSRASRSHRAAHGQRPSDHGPQIAEQLLRLAIEMNMPHEENRHGRNLSRTWRQMGAWYGCACLACLSDSRKTRYRRGGTGKSSARAPLLRAVGNNVGQPPATATSKLLAPSSSMKTRKRHWNEERYQIEHHSVFKDTSRTEKTYSKYTNIIRRTLERTAHYPCSHTSEFEYHIRPARPYVSRPGLVLPEQIDSVRDVPHGCQRKSEKPDDERCRSARYALLSLCSCYQGVS